MVGMKGFEPLTSWSRTRRTAKLCYIPLSVGSYILQQTHEIV